MIKITNNVSWRFKESKSLLYIGKFKVLSVYYISFNLDIANDYLHISWQYKLLFEYKTPIKLNEITEEKKKDLLDVGIII